MKTSRTCGRFGIGAVGPILVAVTVLAAPAPADEARPSTARAWAGAVTTDAASQGEQGSDPIRAPVRVARAGDAAGAAAGRSGEDGDGPMIPTGSLLSIVHDGGILMVPLLGCSFLLASFGIERVVSLRWGRVVPRLFVERFIEQLEAGELDRDDALDACEANGSPAANVFAAAVRRWGKAAVEVEQAVIDACERELNHLRRYRRIFGSVATIGPLLGLLGTVFGLIRSFNDVASAGAMGRPDLLAKGFGEALITTAMGLLVAIPAMLMHSFFTSRADRLALRLDETAQRVIDCVALETANDPRRRKKRDLRAAA